MSIGALSLFQFKAQTYINSISNNNNCKNNQSINTNKSSAPLYGTDDVCNDYIFNSVIGKGTFGEVFAAVNRRTGKRVVIKKVDNAHMKKAELEAAMILNHPGIPKLFAHYENGKYHYMVMEYMPGEDLFSYFERRGFEPMEEARAKKIFRELVKILVHAHSKGIVHRDIKLENILIDAKNKVSLIDWGLCDFVCGKKDILSGRVGSLEYVSPEVMSQPSYPGRKTDVWSCGVILFVLLYAVFPFETKARVHSVRHNLPHPPLVFPNEGCTVAASEQGDEHEMTIQPVSKEAKELISLMLTEDSEKRPTIDEVLNHKWLKSDLLSWSRDLFYSW